MKFWKVLNDVGSGEISLPLGDSKAPSIGQVVRLAYRGAERFAFFVENIETDNTNRMVRYSGRGLLSVLEQAIVYGDGNPPAGYRNFSTTPIVGTLTTAIAEAKVRGCFPTLTLDFDAVTDSNLVPLPDSSSDMVVKIGTTVLRLLKDIVSEGVYFDISSDMVLHAYNGTPGSDMSDSVIFRVGHNCVQVRNQTTSSELKNVITIGANANLPIEEDAVSDAGSISAYGRREMLFEVAQASTDERSAIYAAYELAARKNPRQAIALEVIDGEGITPRVFVDYDVADTVGVDFGTGAVVDYSVQGIQVEPLEGGAGARVLLQLNIIPLDAELRNLMDVRRNLNGGADSLTGTAIMSSMPGTDGYIGSGLRIPISDTAEPIPPAGSAVLYVDDGNNPIDGYYMQPYIKDEFGNRFALLHEYREAVWLVGSGNSDNQLTWDMQSRHTIRRNGTGTVTFILPSHIEFTNRPLQIYYTNNQYDPNAPGTLADIEIYADIYDFEDPVVAHRTLIYTLRAGEVVTFHPSWDGGWAVEGGVETDTTNFGGILSAADDTVQKALDTLDDHVHLSGGQYRQFTYVVTGGDFSFIIDGDGKPVMALQNLESYVN